MTRPASTPAAEATARMVARSYPAATKTLAAALRMRASVRRRCSAREPGLGVVMIHSTGVDRTDFFVLQLFNERALKAWGRRERRQLSMHPATPADILAQRRRLILSGDVD